MIGVAIDNAPGAVDLFGNHDAYQRIAAGKRGKNSDVSRIVRDEGERMLAAIPKNCHIVTLDVPGKAWTTENLAGAMRSWRAGITCVAPCFFEE
jgi:rRNA large subunit m3Psi methyltransferase RlmH